MRVLLDTHVVLWWADDAALIRDEAREAITDTANEVFLSAASVWEAAVKAAAGRLTIPAQLDDIAASAGMQELPVTWRHARRGAALPPIHNDPFDRLLVGQALEEGLVLITRDPLVRQYAVQTLAA